MVDKPEKQGSRGPEDVERNPRAAASEVHNERKLASQENDGRQPLRLEELLERAKTDPIARDIVDGLNKLDKVTDEQQRKELIRWLSNSATMHFHRDLADLKALEHAPHSKHDKQIEAMLHKGRSLIHFTADVPRVITQELKAIREEERKQGKPMGFVEHAMTMLKNLKESVMPNDMKNSADKALREAIAEQLKPELEELRTKKEDGAEKLPETKILEATVKSFDQETLTNVQLLEKALHAPGPFGLPIGEHVDFKQLKDVLDGLSIDKRQQVAEAFMTESKSENSFFDDLRWLGGDHPADIQEIESLFDRKKGVTDWAGDLQNDLIRLKELKQKDMVIAGAAVAMFPGLIGTPERLEHLGLKDPQVANVERAMRHTVAMMPSTAINELKEQHHELYNQLTTDQNVGADTRGALKIMLDQPSWSKQSESITKMARLALDSNNFDLFKDAMRFSSQEARDIFAKTPEANEAIQKYSLQAETVSDLIAHGNESLITGLHQNTKVFGWLGANREEVARLVEFADPNDRAAFTQGEAFSKLKNPSEDQKALIDYFRSVDKALKNATLYDKTEYDVLKRKMTGTPEIYTDLRKLHNDGFLGNWQKNDLKGMKKIVENLSEENWKSLREHPDHLSRLGEDLKDFLDDKERAEIMRMLTEKVGDATKDNLTYEKSKERGRRSIAEFFREEVPEDSWNQIKSQEKSRLSKLDRILQLTPAEKEEYRKDQKAIDKLVSTELKGDELLVARRKLSQVLKGDEKPDLINDALLANLHETNNATRARRLDSALATMDLEQLKNPKSETDKEVRKSFEEMIKRFCDDTGRGRRYDQDGQLISEGAYDEFIKKTFETGRLPMELKVSLLKESPLSIEDLTHLSKVDAQKLLAKNSDGQFLQNEVFKSKEQAALAREILELKNPKNITELMRIRAAVVGFDEPLGKIIDGLAAMKPKERAQIEQEYLKYHSTMNADLLHTATGADRRKLMDTYSPVPIGQKILSLQSDLSKQDGAADGVLMGGALDAHSKVVRVYAENKEVIAKLDPKTKEDLDHALENYFAAKANFVSTKRESAEAVAGATTMLIGIALSIADPPASAAILASAGVVGAGVKLQMTRAMMGSDFDESQSLKIAGSGFMDISFGFADKVIPLGKLIRLDAKVAAEASEAVCNKIATASTVSIMKDDARELLRKGMSDMSLTHCAFGSKEFEHEVHKLAKSLLKDGADPKEVEQLVGLIKKETRERISASVKQKLRNELYKAGESSTVETGTGLTKESILEPDKMKLDELGIKSTSEMVNSLLKCIELRVAGHAIGKTLDHANLQFAKRELFESAKNTMPKANYLRVIHNTKKLEERLNNPKETAKTLREITHFFSPQRAGMDIDLDVMPKAEALRHRGEMTLYELANPEVIHQGFNSTCNATVVQKQLAFNAPYRYAQIAKDISCYDTFITADGTVVKPSLLGAFAKDREELIYEGRRNNWSTTEDLHREHFRRPTEKSMQTVFANAHWSRAEREICVQEIPQGLLIVPPNTEGAVVKKFAPGEVAFFGTIKDHQLSYKQGDEWVPFLATNPDKQTKHLEPFIDYSSPHVGSEHLEDMYNQVAGPGYFDEGFVLIGPTPANADSKLVEQVSRSQTFVRDDEHLRQILLTRFKNGKGATAIAVDASKLDPSLDAEGHIILGRYNQQTDNCNIFNSWGKKEPDLDFKTLFRYLLEEKFDGTPGQ